MCRPTGSGLRIRAFSWQALQAESALAGKAPRTGSLVICPSMPGRILRGGCGGSGLGALREKSAVFYGIGDDGAG